MRRLLIVNPSSGNSGPDTLLEAAGARDVGLDRDDPIGSLDAFVDGAERTIDVGRANDRLFLNNVSLGVYARLVHRREHHRRRRDAFARLRALGTLATHRDS